MATVIRARLPAAEFALAETFRRVGDVHFQCERIVKSGEDVVMPLIWSYGVDAESLNAALDDDPSVSDYSLLAEYDEELLYRMEWIDQVRLVLDMMTNSQATVLSAYGDGQHWSIRALYPDRDSLSHTHDFCEQNGLTFDIEYVREMDGEPAGRFGLSKEQYEALTMACSEGYFKVPREVDLKELAEKIGVSHQALSERLRRGHDILVQESLLVGSPPVDAEEAAGNSD